MQNTMRLRLNDPSLMPDLTAFLQRGGLTVGQDGDTLLVTVFRPLNAPRDESADRLQILGEVRGWLSLHRGARVDCLPGF
jgi:hypothetical protein